MTQGTTSPGPLKKLTRIAELLRSSIDENIPLAAIQTFLVAVQNPGEGVNDLAARVGMSKSTMSRHLLDLSERLRSGAQGYGILKRTPDPVDLRVVRYEVTPKGTLIVNQITDIMEA